MTAKFFKGKRAVSIRKKIDSVHEKVRILNEYNERMKGNFKGRDVSVHAECMEVQKLLEQAQAVLDSLAKK